MERLINEAQQTTIMDAKDEPNGYYYLLAPKQPPVLKLAQASRHAEILATPSELAEFAKEAIAKWKTAKPDAAFLVSMDRIAFVHSIADRRDLAICPLTLSQQYQKLAAFEKGGTALTQRDFISLLRVTMRGNVVSSGLLPLIRTIKFDQGSNGTTSIQQGSEQMGRQIFNKVMGTDAIPEEFQLDIPIFEEYRIVQRVDCALDVDVTTQRFGVTPFPQQLQQAREVTMQSLVSYFQKEVQIPAFMGRVQ